MRWLFRITATLTVALLVLGVGLLLLPGEKIARIAADQVRIQTGRTLSIEGEVKLSYWPVLGVRTGPVRLSNADWAGPEPLLSAESLSIGIAAPALLSGSIKVTEIVAHAPRLALARNDDGVGNWVFASRQSGEAGGSSLVVAGEDEATRDITLQRIMLTDASLEYVRPGEDTLTLSGLEFSLRWRDRDAPAEVTARVNLTENPVTADLRIDDFDGFLEGRVSPLAAELATKGGSLSFDGRAVRDGDAAGRVRVSARNSQQMLAAFGVTTAVMPEGLGRSVELAADATFTTDGRLSLREMTLDLDGNAMSGAADIQFGETPQIIAQLSAGFLDISTLAAPAPQGGNGTGDISSRTGAGWSRDPIDAGLLALFEGTLSLRARKIRTARADLGRTRAVLKVNRSRAVLELRHVQVFDGTVSGQLVANNRAGLSVGGKLHASEINLAPAMKHLAGVETMSGRAEAAIDFLGVGRSIDAIMNSLKGKGTLSMEQGQWTGLDLDRLLQNGETGSGTMVFDSLDASFTIDAGQLVNDDLVLALPDFRVEGSGRVGLGARDIDYLISPIALNANSGEGLAIPIRIRGSWDAPDIRPDLEAALEAKASVKLDDLEDEARASVEQKLREELDINPEDDQDLEESIKDRADEELRNGLRKLLAPD